MSVHPKPLPKADPFFIVQESHCRFLKGDFTTILILSFLINQIRMKLKNPKDAELLKKKSNWFCCPAKLIKAKLGIQDSNKIRRALEKLKNLNLIEKKNSSGNKLWIRINTDELEKIQNQHNRSVPAEDLITYLQSLPYPEYLKTTYWNARRKKAYQLADHRCQLCYTNNEPLNAHHRTYERLGCEKDTDLIVLCRSCHEKFHDILPKQKDP